MTRRTSVESVLGVSVSLLLVLSSIATGVGPGFFVGGASAATPSLSWKDTTADATGEIRLDWADREVLADRGRDTAGQDALPRQDARAGQDVRSGQDARTGEEVESGESARAEAGNESSTNATLRVVLLEDSEAYQRLENSNLTYEQKAARFKSTRFYERVRSRITRYGRLQHSETAEGAYFFFLNGLFVEMNDSAVERVENLSAVEETWTIADVPEDASGHQFADSVAAGQDSPDAGQNLSASTLAASADAQSKWESVTSQNWGYEEVGLEAYHDELWPNYRGRGLDVVVIDSGFDVDHPVYNPVWQGEDFEPYHVNVVGVHYYCQGFEEFLGPSGCISDQIDDEDGHGTSSAGVVWQAAPNANFYVAEVPLDEAKYSFKDAPEMMIESFEWAHRDVDPDVITTSYGVDTKDDDGVVDHRLGGTATLSTVASEAADSDTVVVASTGNSANGDKYPGSPGAGNGVLGIASTEKDDQAVPRVFEPGSPANRHNGKPELAAPGEDVVTLGLNGNTATRSGSSFATPTTAGVALLLMRGNSAEEVRSALLSSAIQAPDSDIDGAGRVSLTGAYDRLYGDDQYPDPKVSIVDKQVNGDTVTFKVELRNAGQASFTDSNGVHLRLRGATFTDVKLGGFDGKHGFADGQGIELYVDGDSATSGTITVEYTDPQNAKVEYRGWIRDQSDMALNPYSVAYERFVARYPDADTSAVPDPDAPTQYATSSNPPYERAARDGDFSFADYETTSASLSPTSTSLTASPEVWDAGTVLKSATVETTITVENTGGISTDLSVTSGSGISTSGVPGSLDPGESASFTATVDASEYSGGSITVDYDGGTVEIPIEVTINDESEYTTSDEEGLSDENDCWVVDVWGPDAGLGCGDQDSPRNWQDSFDLRPEEYAGLKGATLVVAFATDPNQGAQDDPLEIYFNGELVRTVESPTGDDWKEVSVTIDTADVEEEGNTVTLKTDDDSMYDVGYSQKTEFQYTYKEGPDLDLSAPSSVDVEEGETVTVQATLTNDGGKPVDDVELAATGGSGLTVTSQTSFDLGTMSAGDTVTKTWTVRLEDASSATLSIDAQGSASIGDDDGEANVVVEPITDPPTVVTHSVSGASDATAANYTYEVAVADPDGDAVEVALEVYDPSDGAWTTVSKKTVTANGTVSWGASPFEENDEGEEARYRFRYADENGHSGTFGPFDGPVVADDDARPPVFEGVSYPASVAPGDSITVTATVSDENSSVASVVLAYRYPNETTKTVAMTESDGTWRATLPAPDSSDAGDQIWFAVNATDADNSPESASSARRTIAVEPPNRPPRAVVGSNRTVEAGATVTLNASGSTDPDGDALSYAWTQTAGPSVTLRDASTATPTFTAPDADEETTLAFEVTVSDGNATNDTATVAVTIVPADSGTTTGTTQTTTPGTRTTTPPSSTRGGTGTTTPLESTTGTGPGTTAGTTTGSGNAGEPGAGSGNDDETIPGIGTPGFGVGPALVALLGGALLASRRRRRR